MSGSERSEFHFIFHSPDLKLNSTARCIFLSPRTFHNFTRSWLCKLYQITYFNRQWDKKENIIEFAVRVANAKIAFFAAAELEPETDFSFTYIERFFSVLTEQLFPSCERAEKHSMLPLDPIPRFAVVLPCMLPRVICIRDLIFHPVSQQIVPAFATIASKKFNDCVWLRRASTIFTILLIGFSNASDMVRWNFNGQFN